MIDWRSLTDKEFESLCYDVLTVSGFKNLTWFGRKGSDRGRDILATKTETITETKEFHRRYLIQCKRYPADPPSVSDLNDAVAWANGHNPDVLMIMVSNTLTSNTHDWIKQIEPQKKYRIVVFEEKDFEHFFERNGETYAKHFGEDRIAPRLAVIRSLLDGVLIDIEAIGKSTGLAGAEVENILEELRRQSIVSSKSSDSGTRYRLQDSISALIDVAKLFLENRQKIAFISSQFLKSMNGPNLMEYVSSRYHLGFEEAHKEALTKLFTISPSALQAALFSPTDLYDTGYAHMKEIKLDARSQKEIMRQFLASFFSTLLEATVKDLRDPALRKALEANSIEGYNIVTKIIMANPANTVLNLHSETTTMLLPVKSEVKAGQLLSATSPDLFIRTGDTLLNLELFDQAIRDYDRAIAGLTDKKVLAIAWNNKGVCMMRLKRKDEAVKCFHEALSNDPSLEKARANLDSCTRS